VPATRVRFYRDAKEGVPVLAWLKDLRVRCPAAATKCAARVRRLAERGYELRRPEVDYLTEALYELRARVGRVNYRILYFFHGRNEAILVHALTKEDRVPPAEIARALRRRARFRSDPASHTHEEEV
jgi:hypothetical protein